MGLALDHVPDQLHLLLLILHQIHAFLDHARGTFVGEREAHENDQKHADPGEQSAPHFRTFAQQNFAA